MERELFPMQASRVFSTKFSNTFSLSSPVKRYHLLVILLVVMAVASPLAAATRIKDIGHFTGVRNNSLAGYGLVIGLKGTGDKQQTVFTQQTLRSMLDRFGVNVDNQTIRVQNIAAVMV